MIFKINLKVNVICFKMKFLLHNVGTDAEERILFFFFSLEHEL